MTELESALVVRELESLEAQTLVQEQNANRANRAAAQYSFFSNQSPQGWSHVCDLVQSGPQKGGDAYLHL